MSSLMQHHGCTTQPRRGYVELLFYKVHPVEQHPIKCDHCGQHWHEEKRCSKCGRYFTLIRRHTPGKETEDVLSLEQAMADPEYQTVKCGDDTCGASNWWTTEDSEPVTLTRPNGTTTTVPRLYRCWRKPVGMFGCWVVFRYNGKEHVPDLSIPIGTEQMPRDAKPLTDDEAAGYWFK